jgi:hypothetical protein
VSVSIIFSVLPPPSPSAVPLYRPCLLPSFRHRHLLLLYRPFPPSLFPPSPSPPPCTRAPILPSIPSRHLLFLYRPFLPSLPAIPPLTAPLYPFGSAARHLPLLYRPFPPSMLPSLHPSLPLPPPLAWRCHPGYLFLPRHTPHPLSHPPVLAFLVPVLVPSSSTPSLSLMPFI